MFIFVPKVGWCVFAYIVLYVFWGCECHCGGYVFVCLFVSVYLGLALEKGSLRCGVGVGGGDWVRIGSPQP